MTRVEHRSDKMDWRTPGYILDLVRQVASIDLDPCTTSDNPVNAAMYYTQHIDDGLTVPWKSPTGIVYCNPPYGRELPKWIDKAILEASCSAQVLMLIPARPDTRWFCKLVDANATIGFWKGRVKFEGATHGAPFPTAFVMLGHTYASRFRRVFGEKCWFA